MAKNEKLTLVQIRYMERRINATRDAAERTIQQQYDAEMEKVPGVKDRSKEEVAKKIAELHPTLNKANMLKFMHEWRHTGFFRDFLLESGVSRDWLENKEDHKRYAAARQALIDRQRKAFAKIVAIATEATDAIYLGDASQLNTILNKMSEVKF